MHLARSVDIGVREDFEVPEQNAYIRESGSQWGVRKIVQLHTKIFKVNAPEMMGRCKDMSAG